MTATFACFALSSHMVAKFSPFTLALLTLQFVFAAGLVDEDDSHLGSCSQQSCSTASQLP